MKETPLKVRSRIVETVLPETLSGEWCRGWTSTAFLNY